ncbi:MAG: hypothetical protein GTN80_09090 [Nitrososphaeria archaeon]|nr:hypothetical protein [Nitrososphaeria archaeon]NIQ33774.1 hypothetical protein [Nitrososphaeria archaeon]
MGGALIGGDIFDFGTFILSSVIYILTRIKLKKEKKLLDESNSSSNKLEIETHHLG